MQDFTSPATSPATCPATGQRSKSSSKEASDSRGSAAQFRSGRQVYKGGLFSVSEVYCWYRYAQRLLFVGVVVCCLDNAGMSTKRKMRIGLVPETLEFLAARNYDMYFHFLDVRRVINSMDSVAFHKFAIRKKVYVGENVEFKFFQA